MSKEVRALIFRMAIENPTWGAPRIHGELLKLGLHLSEITVSRWLRRSPKAPNPAQRWLTFLRNHREAIAAMDFFTVPTLTFGGSLVIIQNEPENGGFSAEGDSPRAVMRTRRLRSRFA